MDNEKTPDQTKRSSYIEKILQIPEDNSTKLKQFLIPWIVYICILAITLIVDWNLRNPNNLIEGGINSSILGWIIWINLLLFSILTLWAAFRFQKTISKIIFFFVQSGVAYILNIWILMIYAVNFIGDTI